MFKMLINIFTPVYNRAYCINRLYESLCRQTCKDFEWLIVDDGSNDNINEVIQEYIRENRINIRFVSQPNGGKHTAINRGVSMASGDMFYIVDSDDAVPSDTVEFILKEGSRIIDNESFAGIVGCDRTFDGHVLSNMPEDAIDSDSIDIRYNRHIVGDMAEVFKTSVLKEFPFPTFAGERFSPEALVWNRIANKYKLRFFSNILKEIEYLPDGLTAKITKLRHQSPIASSIYYSEFTRLNVPLSQKIKGAINFWRFYVPESRDKISPLNPLLSLIGFIPGKLMRLNDRRNGQMR